LVAPKVGGITASDGEWIQAHQMIEGGPSVLYDAVVLLPSAEAVSELVEVAAARDFVADAFAHCKYIGYVEAAVPLLARTGITDSLDEGTISLEDAKSVGAFVKSLGSLRVWAREPSVKLK
ncbi:catalase HPII, partial [Ensifer sp. BRP08]|nr:catalase HPII [Ensifer sp. BRP08]